MKLIMSLPAQESREEAIMKCMMDKKMVCMQLVRIDSDLL